MTIRLTAPTTDPAVMLLDLIEQRFGLRLDTSSVEHLHDVYEHYRDKRSMLLREHGEAGALASESYAKAVLISEAARLLVLREISPRPRKKRHTRKKDLS